MSVKNLPSGYVQTGRWGASQLSVWEILLVVTIGGALLYVSFLVAYGVTWAAAGSNEVTFRGGGTLILGIILGGALGGALHELAHAATFSLFGARPGFGFKPWTRIGPVFYVSGPGSYFSRAEFAIVGLAPPPLLAVLLLPVLALAPTGGLIYSAALWAFVAGVAGSAGDVIILWKVMQYPPGTYVEDSGDGFAGFGPEGGREPQ